MMLTKKIVAKVEAEIQKAKKEKSRQKLIELINYVNIKFLTEKFNVENRLNFITILLSEKLSIEAEKALLQVFQSFENKNEIIQLHVFLESEKIEGSPLIIKIIEGFSDINPFGINEDGNHIYFEKLLVSQWVVRYQDELPKDEDIKEYHATYPTSQGTQKYSWWDYQFNKNPATIIFTKGYQARDKPKKLVGNPQEYKLLSSTVPFYIAEKREILYVPAIYGYMLSEWKKSRTAELTIEILIGLIADVATDGLFRYLRTVKYLDEVGDVMGAKKIGGVGNRGEVSNLAARVQAKLSLYPKIPDPRTGINIKLPYVDEIVPKADRVSWDLNARGKYIKEWYDRGYTTPTGGWDKYDIHHIKPREFGGTNDFWNLVPVERTTHQKEFNEFWRQFGEL